MSIKKDLPFNITDICQAFNIRVEDFAKLVQKSNTLNTEAVQDISVADAVPKFLKWFQDKVDHGRKSSQSLKLYQGYLNKFLSFMNDKYPGLTVMQLNENYVHEFLQLYEGRKKADALSPYTVNNVTAIFRSLITYCFKQRLISVDSSRDFEWEKTTTLPKYFSPEELDQLLKASLQLINGYRSYAILSFLAGSGARIGEALNMRISDVNFQEGFIFIPDGKGNKPRHIPLDPMVRDILLDYLNITGVKQITSSMAGYLFSKDYGEKRLRKITREAVEKMFRKLVLKLELNPEFTVHSLRHTFSVNCLRNGMPLHILQQILGHTDLKTTGIYTKLFPKDILEELNRYFPFQFGKLMLQTLDEEDDNEINS
ncbi:tyrosine-type recombinase/integrase [Paenibacillus sp. MAH-36]|uniref:Site-specific integrase n=1 Tax=Paenibacillus violae TaxID=3077234 RepID=A0ABU3RNF8_9BACL|nr:site-specific integrase [Paenibacillus sp. PFR10]MDU0205817.1 site-specific integrase [Paenibacillus sp. PFR10]